MSKSAMRCRRCLRAPRLRAVPSGGKPRSLAHDSWCLWPGEETGDKKNGREEMARGKIWTRDELIIAMNLYCKLPFGQLHYRNPTIIEMAHRLGRTPGSLAMKLCNLASLDPIQQARGIKGLSGASSQDREIWAEFHLNWTDLAEQSESLVAALTSNGTSDPAEGLAASARRDRQGKRRNPPAETEAILTVRARRGQDFFRQAVLASYGNRCCITANPVPDLLVAGHIAPWSEFPKERLNPRNGLCLAAMHDAAFDRGLVTLDEDKRLVLSGYLKDFLSAETIRLNFASYEGKAMRPPNRFEPDEVFLQHHREHVFKG